MKVSHPTHYDCTLFILSQSFFLPIANQRIQKRHKSTDDRGHHYLVKQVDKVVNGGTFEATLFCTDVALFPNIQIAISGMNCVDLSGMHIEENEHGQETQADFVELSGMHTEENEYEQETQADSVELSGMYTEEDEHEQEAQEVLSECLSKAQKIEVVMYYPADKNGNYLGSLYVDDQILGDMLLKESFGEEDL